ncbi:MAG: hypothetical protein QXE64_01130 [Candidatus Pacearchaeota archaeon]
MRQEWRRAVILAISTMSLLSSCYNTSFIKKETRRIPLHSWTEERELGKKKTIDEIIKINTALEYANRRLKIEAIKETYTIDNIVIEKKEKSRVKLSEIEIYAKKASKAWPIVPFTVGGVSLLVGAIGAPKSMDFIWLIEGGTLLILFGGGYGLYKHFRDSKRIEKVLSTEEKIEEELHIELKPIKRHYTTASPMADLAIKVEGPFENKLLRTNNEGIAYAVFDKNEIINENDFRGRKEISMFEGICNLGDAYKSLEEKKLKIKIEYYDKYAKQNKEKELELVIKDGSKGSISNALKKAGCFP